MNWGNPEHFYHAINWKYNSVEWRAYYSARKRCTDKKDKDYRDYYGGRGITFIFRSFSEFLEHIGPKPDSSYKLDRIRPNGNYEIGNIRWVCPSINSCNQRLRRTNRTGYRGIQPRARGWVATIGRENHYLGFYSSPEEAAMAYDQAAIERFGMDAKLNYPVNPAPNSMSSLFHESAGE